MFCSYLRASMKMSTWKWAHIWIDYVRMCRGSASWLCRATHLFQIYIIDLGILWKFTKINTNFHHSAQAVSSNSTTWTWTSECDKQNQKPCGKGIFHYVIRFGMNDIICKQAAPKIFLSFSSANTHSLSHRDQRIMFVPWNQNSGQFSPYSRRPILTLIQFKWVRIFIMSNSSCTLPFMTHTTYNRPKFPYSNVRVIHCAMKKHRTKCSYGAISSPVFC